MECSKVGQEVPISLVKYLTRLSAVVRAEQAG
jgi:hypothetical protein